MPSQRFEQGADAAMTDEGHDDVDTICRTNLGQDLVAHTRLARGIGEQCGVQQRNQRRGDEIRTPVRQATYKAVQYIAGSPRSL